MKIALYVLLILIAACSSKVAMREGNEYAYLYTKQLEKTPRCDGQSIKIVGVRQAGKKAVFTSVHSIYIPEGRNYIYYMPIYEYLTNGVCRALEEVVIRHSEVPVSPLKELPMGIEFEVNVEAGKSYVLEYNKGKLNIEEYEY